MPPFLQERAFDERKKKERIEGRGRRKGRRKGRGSKINYYRKF